MATVYKRMFNNAKYNTQCIKLHRIQETRNNFVSNVNCNTRCIDIALIFSLYPMLSIQQKYKKNIFSFTNSLFIK